MTATAAPKTPSVWEDFIDIFTSPSDVFARRRDGNFFLPMIVVTLIFAVIFIGAKSLLQPAMDADFMRQMAAAARNAPQLTPDIIEKQRSMVDKINPYIIPIGYLIGMFLTGWILWFVGKLFDSTMTATGGLLVAGYSQIPRVFGIILAPIIARFSDPASLTSMTKLTVSPAHFFDVSTTSPIVVAMLSRLDVFTIWATILLAIGLSVLGKIPRSRAYVAAAIVWLLCAVPVLYQAIKSI